jgi:hypothetical protein
VLGGEKGARGSEGGSLITAIDNVVFPIFLGGFSIAFVSIMLGYGA